MALEFFTGEIIENEAVRAEIAARMAEYGEAEREAERFWNGAETPEPEAGFFPILILGFLADRVLAFHREKGIAREITVATLKDVNCWIENYRTQTGRIGLDAFSWLTLHYTGQLYRIGRLQFKPSIAPPEVPSGAYVLDTHIPQGEPLRSEECEKSFAEAKRFFKQYFGDVRAEYFVCASWLLNPALASLAAPESNIVRFMKLWTPFPIPPDHSAQAMERVFGFGFTREMLADAPEKTGLQRALKAFLLAGNELNETAGYRKLPE